MLPITDERLAFRRRFPPRAIDIAGRRWEYFAAGRGTRGLLILGGELAFGDTAHRLITKFAHSHRVISPSYPHVESAPEIVDGLVQLLNVERLEQVDVFGDGLGAGLAHLLARSYPGSVARIALTNFGLLTHFRTIAMRTRLEMLRFMTHGSVRQHYEHVFERHACAAGERGRSRDIIDVGRELLDRHAEESALNRLRLFADLFRGDDALRLARYVPLRALLLLAADDPSFTRLEQDNLLRTYPEGSVVRHQNAGRLLGITAALELERKLELFFRVTPSRLPFPQTTVSPAVVAPDVRPARIADGAVRTCARETRIDWVES
jgi:pimeloyl-ACP methyl ester carboxylesterase